MRMKSTDFHFESFKTTGQEFLRQLIRELIEHGLPAQSFESDHLCFRVGSSEVYEFYKEALSHHGELLTESQVNGRAISTFRLHSPFKTDTHKVPLVELPAPKAGSPYSTGFEHAEFVIRECFDTFRSKFPHLRFSSGGNKTLNPELCLKLTNGRQAKFHHLPLDRVIELEEAEIRDIIFDFDGTLVNSREHIHEINRIVFSTALGREVLLEESVEKFHSEFSKLFEAFGLTCPIKRSETISSWGVVSEKFSYRLFEGALEALQVLRDHGFRLHLWTARDEYSARKILREHDLEGFFETLSFANEADSKPHVNSLRFDWKGTGKNQVLVIGDSPADILGAKNIAAIRGAALWDPYVKKGSLTEAGAELFFHAIADFSRWMTRGNGPTPTGESGD